jgi:hypothetical protein
LTVEEHADPGSLVDSCGLQNILNALFNVCADKAEHIRTNWQDELLAKAWEVAGQNIDAAASSPAVAGLSR